MNRGTPSHATFMQDGYAIRLEPVKAPVLSPDALREFEGTFASALLDTKVAMKVEEGKLTYRGKRVAPFSFAPIAPDAFVGPYDMIVRFSRDSANRVSGFTLAQQRLGRVEFVRVAGLAQ